MSPKLNSLSISVGLLVIIIVSTLCIRFQTSRRLCDARHNDIIALCREARDHATISRHTPDTTIALVEITKARAILHTIRELYSLEGLGALADDFGKFADTIEQQGEETIKRTVETHRLAKPESADINGR